MCLVFPLLGAEARWSPLGERMRGALRDFDRKLERDATPSIRDVTNGALAKLALDGDVAGAETLLRFAMAQQGPDGNVPWQVGHPEIKDANAIEFASQAIGPILLHYGKQLSPQVKADLIAHAKRSFPVIRAHNVKVGYTNIYLMKTVSMILMGEAVGDASAADEGYAMLAEWIRYTNENGIREFLSPTYYSCDLNSLYMGYLYAARPGAHETFRKCLDYFWTDIAANFFPGRGVLAGPHSRDYDFLTGNGGLLVAADIAGLRPPYTAQFDFEKVFTIESAKNHGYEPPEKILRLAGMAERVVAGRYDPPPYRDRYNYLTPDFAIGSATGDYGPQDKMVNITLKSAKEGFPEITVVPDVFDEPYGKARRKDRSGHSKPVHLPLHPTTVQEKGALLVMLDLDLSKEDAEKIATNVILPAEADEIRQTGSVTGVREGKAAVAIRILAAGAELKKDGLKWKSARLALYHPSRDKHVRTAILFLAAKCENEADFAALLKRAREAKVSDTTEAGVWRVKAEMGSLTLEGSRGPTLERMVNGKPVDVNTALVVNGTPVRIE